MPQKLVSKLLVVVVVGVAALTLATARARSEGDQIYRVLHLFDCYREGAYPAKTLLLASDGTFYGTLSLGPQFEGPGAIFRAMPDGDVTIIAVIPPGGPSSPSALVQAPDGALYGLTISGGIYGGGTAFRVSLKGDFEVIYEFGGPGDGTNPVSSLVLLQDGRMFGSTVGGGLMGGGTLFTISESGHEKIVHSFDPNGVGQNQGYEPTGLTIGADHLIYGVVQRTNTAACKDELIGCGGEYRVLPDGESYQFEPMRLRVGSAPIGAPVVAFDGTVFGSDLLGGKSGRAQCTAGTCGTIWSVAGDGGVHLVHEFNGNRDGSYPSSDLMQASDGRFYGTTPIGGAGAGGTIFRFSADGKFENVHEFMHKTGGKDSTEPTAGLTEGPDHALYGVTTGGSHDCGGFYRLSVTK